MEMDLPYASDKAERAIMAPHQQKSKASAPQRSEREIDALLKRLHSGCRFIQFEDVHKNDISNMLRNAAQPDEVHSELGRALAHSYMTSLDVDVGERILLSLCCGEATENSNQQQTDKTNYASAANAFFSYLAEYLLANNNGAGHNISAAQDIQQQIRSKWLQWCVRCEELVSPAADGSSIQNGGGRSVLFACLKNYSLICFGKSSVGGCDMVYRSLKRSTSRKYWIRSVASALQSAVTTLGRESEEAIVLFQEFHPLFEACTLQARGKIQLHDLGAHNEESRLILNETLRICTMNLHNDGSVYHFTMKMIEYLTNSLVPYLDQLVYISSANSHESVAVLELSYEWLRGLSDLIRSASTKDLDEDNTKSLTTAIDTIIVTILPQLSSSISSFELTSIYATIESSINSLEQYSTFTTANSVVAMRMGTLALSLKSDREVNGVCDLLLSIFSSFTYEETLVYNDISFVGGILYALGCVFSSRLNCANKALIMKQVGEQLMQRTPTVLDVSISSSFSLVGDENSEGFHLIDLLAEMKAEPLSTNYQHLIELISKSISNVEQTKLHSWRRRPLALEDQCSGLLAGLTLLHMSVLSPSLTECGYQRTLDFLASFLECYPRAASRVLPSVVDTVRMSSQQSSPLPQILSNSVKFIASKPIVSDPHGAHLAWTYLSPLTNDGVPAATRASVIRVLPQMCLNNKKLFRRIRDVVGKSMLSTDPMVRIAATATLSDMAKLDLLRDVEGIVSWIQGRLNDEESTVTYFALSALRYLVQNEELDFDLVVRVLEKRLALEFGSVDDFLGWDILVLESLVELLGEGGLEEDDDEESHEEEEEKEGGPEPTAKTVKAVSLLIELALKIDSDDERYDLSTQARILSKIYQSLANYSALILGLDSESIRTCADATSIPGDLSGDWDRYLELKKMVQGGMNLVTRMQDLAKDDDIGSITTEFSNNLVATIQLLLSFEEETFGSFVFRKGGSSSKGKNEGAHQHRVSKSVLSALPEISTVRSMFESDESVSARAAAYFYALGIEDDNGPIPRTSALLAEMTECISHFAPPADPPAYAMQVFSIINAMSTVFRSIQNADENSREQLFETAVEQLEEWATEFSEYGYVALSALALAADDSPQFYSAISRVQNTILDGCDMFESEDVKLLCECMVAARLSRTTDTRVVALIHSVEKSIERHNGQSCFGGYLGLGIFVQSVSRKMRLTGSDPSEVWCREQTLRCICILAKSLNNCILTQDDSILKLASCIETGKLTDTLSLPSDLIIKDGAAQKAGGVIIGLSHCFPALAGVSTDLLKGVIAVIDELPWGSGKGFATHATYKTLIDAGVYSFDDLSEAITTTMACVQGFDNDCIDLSDSLFSLVSLCRLSAGKVKVELDLINETTERILSATSRMTSKGKTMSIFTRCASIGELPGVTSFGPSIHSSVKKEQVSSVVDMLEETLSNGEVECTHASALALGVLCAMRNSSQTIQQHKHEKKSDRKNVDVNSIIQGKGGTIMEFVLQQVAKAHSDVLSQHSDTKRAAKQLCILFEALEAVALPGSFSRVIETTLHSSAVEGTELTDSSLKILFSQIESGRRRIGFDGRGFLDMSARLTKLPTEDLRKLVGATGAQQMMAAMSNLLFQLPTSAGEEVAKCLWCICRDLSNHQMVMTEFFIGMKTIFASAGKESKDKSKLSTSPALLRTLHNLVANGLFDEFCEVAAQSSKIDSTSSSYATTIAAYLECLDIISASAISTTDAMGIQSDISHDNVLVMASCSSFSSKQTRRVETWIARQNVRDDPSNLRMLLLSSLAVAPQSRNEIEMKESIVNLLDIMLVAGVDNTLCIELIAAKVAYWWDSRNMNDMSAAMHPIQRVSTMSSFLVFSNLCFEVQSLPNKELTTIFDLFVTDLPAKLALLCQAWKISDDVSNRATRLCKDATDSKKACLERIIQLLDGGRDKF